MKVLILGFLNLEHLTELRKRKKWVQHYTSWVQALCFLVGEELLMSRRAWELFFTFKTIPCISPSGAPTVQECINAHFASQIWKFLPNFTVPMGCLWLPRHCSAGGFLSTVEWQSGPSIWVSVWLNPFQQIKQFFFFFDCVCSMLITKAILLFFLCHFFLYDIMYMPDTKMCRKVNKWKYRAEFLCMVIIHVEMQFLADQNIDSFKLETANRIW